MITSYVIGTCMSYNQRLVDYFTSEFYQFEVTDLAHLASPTFTFVINASEPKSFDEFEKRRRFLFLISGIKHGPFTSTDDESFYATVEILTLEGEKANGVIMFNIRDGLVQRVDVKYDFTEEEFANFFDALFENYAHFI